MSKLVQPVETEDGDRLIPGTRRPDGTIRKERRVRPGFTPQEEQPVYESRGMLARQNIPVCPGLDPAMLVSASSQAASKAAKKNEKRKEKKAAGEAGGEGAAASGTSAAAKPATAPVVAGAGTPASAVKAVTAKMGALSTGKESKPSPAPPAAAAPPPAAPAAAIEDPKVAAEKALRNLRKKVRQAEDVLEKRKAGATLNADQEEKVANLPAWLQEVQALERQLAAQ